MRAGDSCKVRQMVGVQLLEQLQSLIEFLRGPLNHSNDAMEAAEYEDEFIIGVHAVENLMEDDQKLSEFRWGKLLLQHIELGF